MKGGGDETTGDRKTLLDGFKTRAKRRCKHINDLLEADIDEAGGTLSEVEAGSGIAMFRLAAAKEQRIPLQECFMSEKQAIDRIKLLYEPKDHSKLFGNLKEITKLCRACRHLDRLGVPRPDAGSNGV